MAAGAQLNDLGIGRGDVIGIVLPNGPEMATAFVSVACSMIAAPLNPSYKVEEFDFYLGDLDAKAVIVLQGDDTPARSAARKRGLAVVELVPIEDGPAGQFTLLAEPIGPAPSQVGLAQTNDIALVLHTSGTTSRPKIVPLSHDNISASAGNIAASTDLKPEDRCLNIMPLFHIHGLIAAVSSSLSAGASIFCTPGFNALKYYSWLAEANATWCTAVPTMHQAVLARAERNREIVENHPLRFLRSSSSSMPPQVMLDLEKTFGCPLIEAYGMTEAAHQMASNPLPPGKRIPGSVGLAAGPEVAIMGENNADLLPPGATGEIVIRGRNVTLGYANNPKANEEAFTDGWFRTGDQGVMTEAGYITITGRLKEIINRGGEKISPREVDEILMDHPAVQQVVTFAMPHDKLGEEVAAAAVLREGAETDEAELRKFAAEHLADFKVPRKILILDEIPKGATGKLQRIGMAEKLGLSE
jgi:acyl-CoA synthetase (AMP-forming)/AMP-acid ligase II